MNFSIVIPTGNREVLLHNCLKSVRDNLVSKLLLTNVYIGFDNDKEGYAKFDTSAYGCLNIKKFLFNKSFPGQIRNRLIEKISDGEEYILFLDDDVILPQQYFELCSVFIEQMRPDIFGGSDTYYPNASTFEKILSDAIQSPFVASASRKRHIISKRTVTSTELDLTLCNMWFKRDLFKKYNFNETYFRNEENEMLAKMSRDGIVAYKLKELYVHHKRRQDIGIFLKSSYNSGYFRMKSIYETPSTSSIVFLVPLLFVYFNLYSAFIGTSFQMYPAALYLLCCLIFSWIKSKKNKSITYMLGLFFVQILIVSIYTAGQFSFLLGKKHEE